MNQIQFIFEFLSTVTKCDNDVLFRKMDDCVQTPLCAVRGRSGGGAFSFPGLEKCGCDRLGPGHSGADHTVVTSWMEQSYTMAIQLLFCRFTQKFNICSCHQQPSPAPRQPSRASWYIFEPPTKSAAKWYFVILWHFCCCIVIVASGGCTPSNKSHTFALLLLMWKTKKKWGFFSIKILHRSSRSQIL